MLQQRTQAPPGLVSMLLGMLSAAALAMTAVPAAARQDGPPAKPELTEAIALEDFAPYALGTFPRLWQTRGKIEEAAAVYRVAKENGSVRFLAARAEDQSVMIGLDREFEPSRYPYLRWRWRVHTFPSGGDERKWSTNDSAAGVYVVFPGRLPLLPRVLKYVWSANAPVGLRQSSPMYNATKIIVVASGPTEEPGQWRTETVNVCSDYESLFGRKAPSARGIGLLTDANETHSVAAADYADFQLLNALPPSSEPVSQPDTTHQ